VGGSHGDRVTVAGRLEGRSVKVIGLGGIGSSVAQGLTQFLASHRLPCTLWLIDGDSYEERNRDRVLFQTFDNKAISKASEFARVASGALTILPVPKYLGPGNVRRLVEERDVIFLCVDNHSTRRSVSNRCRKLANVLLISGGNDGIEDGRPGTFGNVMVYIRAAGRDQTSPLTRFHPEIARPADRRPDQQSCGELAQSTAPQLLFTNLAVASAMLGTFYSWLSETLDYEEIFLDIAQGKMTSVTRSVRGR